MDNRAWNILSYAWQLHKRFILCFTLQSPEKVSDRFVLAELIAPTAAAIILAFPRLPMSCSLISLYIHRRLVFERRYFSEPALYIDSYWMRILAEIIKKPFPVLVTFRNGNLGRKYFVSPEQSFFGKGGST